MVILGAKQWMQKVQMERTGGKRGRVWMEVQNYYVQRFSGYRWKGLGPDWSKGESSEHDPSAPNWAQLFDRAVEVQILVKCYQLVFIS